MKNIRDQDYVIALALDGKMLDSVELLKKSDNWELKEKAQLLL
mgnify:CR=1 FL=1